TPGFQGQLRTRIYGFVIYQHAAGTTFRTVAYALSAGDVQFIAQSIEQSNARLQVRFVLLAVDGELHGPGAGAMDRHLFPRGQYRLWPRDEGYSYRDAGNFEEVAPGNAGPLVLLLFLFRIIFTHPYPPMAGRVAGSAAGLSPCR